MLICCGECQPDTYLDGLDEMMIHILSHHKSYTVSEAREYAEAWLKEAEDRWAEEAAELYRARKEQAEIDRALGKD